MNAFAPRYDPATGRAVMYPHPDGAWVHVGDALEMKAEVERLREVVRQVHAMTGRGIDWAAFPGVAATALREIHKITKGMVE